MTGKGTNFGFLDRCDDRVAHLARQAERYVYTDPDSCLFKLRLMIETMRSGSSRCPHRTWSIRT